VVKHSENYDIQSKSPYKRVSPVISCYNHPSRDMLFRKTALLLHYVTTITKYTSSFIFNCVPREFILSMATRVSLNVLVH